MADTFGLEIYASNKLAFAGRGKTLTIPAVDGEQAFLAQHENIVAAIIPQAIYPIAVFLPSSNERQ